MCPVSVPHSAVEPITDILHGVPVTDPYRWLEDQHSPETRAWIAAQTGYARCYLDRIPGRERMRERVRKLLDVESFDSFLKAGNRYFFRKRSVGQEQPSIYFREGPEGQDQLLVDPDARGSGSYTAVKPLQASADGSLLLYEVKQGGERMGTFETLDVATRTRHKDALPRGYLRGFAFAPDGKSFYYVHESEQAKRPFYRAAYQHALGGTFDADREIFFAGEDQNLQLALVFGCRQLGLLVYRFLDKTYTDFSLCSMGSSGAPLSILRNADYIFAPRFVGARILAATDRDAPNVRIVEVQPQRRENPLYFPLIPEADAPIRSWVVTANHIVAFYTRRGRTALEVFETSGKHLGNIPCGEHETVRILAAGPDDDEILLERESFTEPKQIHRCSLASGQQTPWAQRTVPPGFGSLIHVRESFASKDGTNIPIFLVGRAEAHAKKQGPALMTSYGGYGIPATPQFSVLVTILLECGCLFALPGIRGGGEFGTAWHNAARRRMRQVAFDDFLAAADWLIRTDRSTPELLAIFGGSNSGLLVGAAITQRPNLFRAALCMVPLLDMLRYQLFDHAHVWKDEFGTADDAADFQALARYSPYHAVRENTPYPATMIVSGDADQNCNSFHARKMTARLQAANSSDRVIVLDYNPHRGHSPVLPLTARIDALTDRVAFLCDQLGLTP